MYKVLTRFSDNKLLLFYYFWHQFCEKKQENHSDNDLEVSIEEFILKEASEVIQSRDIVMVSTNDE